MCLFLFYLKFPYDNISNKLNVKKVLTATGMEKYTQENVSASIAELHKAISFLEECWQEKNIKNNHLLEENQNLIKANAELLSAKAELINKYEEAKPIIREASQKIASVITTLQNGA